MISLHASNNYTKLIQRRCLSVVAWGLNSWGECGAKAMTPLLPTPFEIQAVEGQIMQSITAGKSHSILVNNQGEVYSFGKGSAGELGTGKTEPQFAAARLEHIVDKFVVGAAAGPTHSYFLADNGKVLATGRVSSPHGAMMWAVEQDGEHQSKEEEELASFLLQDGDGRRSNSQYSISSENTNSSLLSSHSRGDSSRLGVDMDVGNKRVTQEPSWASMHLVPLVDHRSRYIEIQNSKIMLSDPLRSLSEKQSAGKLWDDHMHQDGTASSFSLPTFLGGGAGLMGAIVNTQSRNSFSTKIKSIYSCSVTGRSILVNEFGVPMMLEPLKTCLYAFKENGVPASWSQAVHPSSLVLEAIEDNGGAIRCGAGESYYVVLTASGKVIIWWDGCSDKFEERCTKEAGPHSIYRQGRTAMLLVNGLPHITQISSSPSTIYCADSYSVWSLEIPTSVYLDRLEYPRRILELKDASIKNLRSGARSGAVVTDEGKLWLWGSQLVSDAEMQKAMHYAEGEGFGHWAYSSTSTDSTISSSPWPGLGGNVEPVEIPGLHGVSDIALGAQHALAAVA
eukprot:jgi/Picsp_1/3738/NSC_06574-R1_e3 isg15--protein ligase herc5